MALVEDGALLGSRQLDMGNSGSDGTRSASGSQKPIPVIKREGKWWLRYHDRP